MTNFCQGTSIKSLANINQRNLLAATYCRYQNSNNRCHAIWLASQAAIARPVTASSLPITSSAFIFFALFNDSLAKVVTQPKFSITSRYPVRPARLLHNSIYCLF